MAYEIATLLVLLLTIIYSIRRPSRRYSLPPGPKKLPIVENLFDIPNGGFVWVEYAKMCQIYDSDIIHLSALGNSIIVLNSAKTVSDLLENRSSIYSSRPPAVMLGELMGSSIPITVHLRWRFSTVLRPADNSWKAQRRIMNQAMPPNDTERFHPKLLSLTHDLLQALPHSNNVMNSLQAWAANLILDVTYGLSGEAAAIYSHLGVGATKSIAIAGTPGAFYVDQIPILKYIPEWFPGASFKRKAREWSDIRTRMTENTFNATKEQVTMGTATPSLTSVALEHMDRKQELTKQEELIKLASVTAYAGGSDTTVAVLGAFILAMLIHPDVQDIAHREIRKVLGPGDLPSFSDELWLPCVTAIVRETLRLHPVAPLAFPHELIQDDIYEGYFLPKNSIIMPNIWSILRNEQDYPEPDLFNPSRFLDADGKIDPTVKDPATAVFGFGRRVCPGKHIGFASLWIAVASILTCYSIEPELDESGKPVKPKAEWYSGPSLFNHPLPFKCRFVPRSKDVELSLGI